MGSRSSKFSHFCDPYGAICMFSKAQHGTETGWENDARVSFGAAKRAVGGPKKRKHGPDRSHGDSWDGLERSWEGPWRSSEGAWGLLGCLGASL